MTIDEAADNPGPRGGGQAVTHSADCAQLEYRPCPANQSLHGEPVDAHWWSGWPGAHCLKCGDEDKTEVCIGGGCECPCHAEFWAAFERDFSRADGPG